MKNKRLLGARIDCPTEWSRSRHQSSRSCDLSLVLVSGLDNSSVTWPGPSNDWRPRSTSVNSALPSNLYSHHAIIIITSTLNNSRRRKEGIRAPARLCRAPHILSALLTFTFFFSAVAIVATRWYKRPRSVQLFALWPRDFGFFFLSLGVRELLVLNHVALRKILLFFHTGNASHFRPFL